MKAAALELNGTNASKSISDFSYKIALAQVNAANASINDKRLCVPLMIVIDELGFRLVLFHFYTNFNFQIYFL